MSTELTVTTYKGFHIDRNQNEEECAERGHDDYLIYDPVAGNYLADILDEGQPLAYDLDHAKKLIDYYIVHGNFEEF
jgi:hypothetical protein